MDNRSSIGRRDSEGDTCVDLLDRFVQSLLLGDRCACRGLIQDAIAKGACAWELDEKLLLPAVERIRELRREDRINTAMEHLATRISRSLAGLLQQALPSAQPTGKRVLITCDDEELEELGAQLYSDMFEARGWDVYFLGGCVPDDEILMLVGQVCPEILMVCGTTPQGVPGVRRLIALIRDIGTNPTMHVLVTGGIFDRVDGLWREVNADLYASTINEVIRIAEAAEPRKAESRTPAGPRKRRRRRRPPLLAALEGREADSHPTSSTPAGLPKPDEHPARSRADSARIPIRLSELISDLLDPRRPDPLKNVEMREFWDTLMRGLSREERLLLTLYYKEEMTLAEIAEVLDLSESRACQIYRDVVSRLRYARG